MTTGSTFAAMNGTTPVEILGAPGASTRRLVGVINIYNADSAAVTVTLKAKKGGTSYVVYKSASLAAGARLVLSSSADDVGTNKADALLRVILDDTDESLTAELAGAIATTNPDVAVTYADYT